MEICFNESGIDELQLVRKAMVEIWVSNRKLSVGFCAVHVELVPNHLKYSGMLKEKLRGSPTGHCSADVVLNSPHVSPAYSHFACLWRLFDIHLEPPASYTTDRVAVLRINDNGCQQGD
jgi:hypothetical protein